MTEPNPFEGLEVWGSTVQWSMTGLFGLYTTRESIALARDYGELEYRHNKLRHRTVVSFSDGSMLFRPWVEEES